MNLLTKAELVAEFIFTFLFKKSVSSIQPVEVAKELLKAMLKNKQVSISNVYVPNVYKVFLNVKDHCILESFGETFLIELARHLYEEGKKQGLTFLNLPVVEIHGTDSIDAGNIEIRVEFNEAIDANWEIEEDESTTLDDDMEKTTVLPDAVRFSSSLELSPGRKYRYYLEIIKGEDEGKIFYLDKEEVTVGRHEECDIELKDLEVSRRHFKLTYNNRRWFVEDAGSTNGTTVNKLKVDKYLVNPGDKIKAGQTILVFKNEKKK